MKTMAGPRTEATRQKLSEGQRRSWREHRAERLRALQNPEVHARRMKSIKKLDDAKVLELLEQGLSQAAIAKRFGVSHAAIHYSLKRQYRLPTSKALECVRRRMAEREAKQASQPPPVDAREPMRLWNLRRDSSVTHATEPPPMPELRGWQKILCGRLG
jgi:hypothetical protein